MPEIKFSFNAVPLPNSANNKKTAFQNFDWYEYREKPYPFQIKEQRPKVYITGKHSDNTHGLLVLNLNLEDPEVVDFNLIETRLKNFGLPINTLASETPSGGRHYYFMIDQEVDSRIIQKINFKKHLFPGIKSLEILCRDRFIVAPPTEWNEGEVKGKYRWLNNSAMRILERSLIPKFISSISHDTENEDLIEFENSKQIIQLLSEVEPRNLELKEEEFIKAIVAMFLFYRVDLDQTIEFVKECPVYQRFKEFNKTDYIRKIYSNPDKRIPFKKILIKYTPGLMELVRSIKYDDYKLFKEIDTWKGLRNFLSHSARGIKKISYQYQDGDSKFVGSKLISDFFLKNYTINIDPHSSMEHHILEFDSIYGSKEIITNSQIMSISDAANEITNYDVTLFKQTIKAMIDKLVHNNKVVREYKERLTGFTIEENKLLFRNNGDFIHEFQIPYTEAEVIEILEFLNYSAMNYPDASHLSTSLKFGIACPFQWSRLILGKKKSIILLRGQEDSAKTHVAHLILAIWNCPAEFSGSSGSISTEARVSSFFNDTTFPKFIDETKNILSANFGSSNQQIFEYLKVSDKAKIIRRKLDYSGSPIVEKNHSSFILSQNEDISISKPLKKRFIQIIWDEVKYKPDFGKDLKKQKIYDKKYLDISPKLAQLGSWIIDNFEMLITIEELKDFEILEVGKLIWKRIYEYFNFESSWIDLPEIVYDEYTSENTDFNNKVKIRNRFRKLFRTAMKPFWSLKHRVDGYEFTDFYSIIKTLDDHSSVPDNFEITRMYRGTQSIYIQNGIVNYLNRDPELELSSLKQLSDFIPLSNYQSARKLGKVLKIGLVDFCTYLDGGESEYNATTDPANNIDEFLYPKTSQTDFVRQLPDSPFTEGELKSRIFEILGYNESDQLKFIDKLKEDGLIMLEGKSQTVIRYKKVN